MKALMCLNKEQHSGFSMALSDWLAAGSHVYISTVSLKGIITPPQPNRTNIQYISAIYKKDLENIVRFS
jgi:hypothetical protein